MENKPNRIIWHHSADGSKVAQAQKINEYHRSKGFPKSSLGLFGGYHFLIEHDGQLFQYRRENEIGAHDAGENINSIGVCLAGNFNIDLPTPAQEAKLAMLLTLLVDTYHIPLDRIEPHRYNDITQCPGTKLPDNWAALIYAQARLTWLQKVLIALVKLIGRKV